MAKFLIKFGTKVGILGGTIYYFREVGVWEDSEKTYELGKQAVTFVKPYFNDIEKEIPVKVNLPSTDDLLRNVRTYWNCGVITSISFMGDIPDLVKVNAAKGISYIKHLQDR